jgi:CRP-like cAMP-binding protein
VTSADLKRFALLAELSDEDRETLFDLLEEKSVRQGRSVYRETAEAEGLVFVVSGEIRLSNQRCGDLGTVGEGTILGGASLLALGRREATAKAEVDCELLMLARTAYHRLVDDSPRTACRLTEALARELAALLRESIEPVVNAQSRA